MSDSSAQPKLPVTYQELHDYFQKVGQATPFSLRRETFLRIEEVTKTPLICYVTKTHHIPQGIPAYIDDSDLVGFGDLVRLVNGVAVDVLLVSNGGSAEATERIVRLLRDQFQRVRFIVPANAYSAATLMCFAGDQILMDSVGTLGPTAVQISLNPPCRTGLSH